MNPLPKPTKKKKRGHRTNQRPSEWVPCEICGASSTSTHELFGGSNRNFSIDNGAQMRLCEVCHKHMHANKEHQAEYRKAHQRRIMDEKGWSVEDWIREVGENYDY